MAQERAEVMDGLARAEALWMAALERLEAAEGVGRDGRQATSVGSPERDAWRVAGPVAGRDGRHERRSGDHRLRHAASSSSTRSGLTPLFLALTRGMSEAERRRVGLRALAIAFAVLALFGLAGEALLAAVGIGMPAFRIAGGLLLFLTAVDMLFERRQPRREQNAAMQDAPPDPTVFPLARR